MYMGYPYPNFCLCAFLGPYNYLLLYYSLQLTIYCPSLGYLEIPLGCPGRALGSNISLSLISPDTNPAQGSGAGNSRALAMRALCSGSEAGVHC